MKYIVRFSNAEEKTEVLSKMCGEILEVTDNMLLIESDFSLDSLREIYKNQIVTEHQSDWDWR